MATSHEGLLTTQHLETLGVTKAARRTLVRNGDLVPLHRGVFAVGSDPLSWEQMVRAALLAPGARRVATHRSALRLHGMRSVDDEIEVAVRHPARSRLDGVIVHRSVDLIERDIMVVRGMEVTTPARSLVDAGLVLGSAEVSRLVDHALAIEQVTRAELQGIRRRVGEHGRTGVGSLDAALESLPTDAEAAESGPEIDLLRLIHQAGLPLPVCQYPVRTRAGRQRRIDMAYPREMLALEYDGLEPHTTPEAFRGDRVRQNELVELGWRVLRFTWHDLKHTPWAVTGQIRRMLVSVA
ncbi:MAG: AbiEi antitoxin N-terminal domain-containing protein [Acidimicrobiales bacterium]|nr:AbiEi antitoxin N-terminal domain-containing protein [Acidimicrobiales bacterium]